MAYYRCGPTATIGTRASWAPVTSPESVDLKNFDRPLSGTFDRIFNAFEKTNAFEYVKNTFEDGKEIEERHIGHDDIIVNRKKSSSYERADSALAAQTPCSEDEDYYREKILYSQARQLFPLQEDLADWINKIIGTSYVTGENFLEALDNGAELCQLAACIHARARDALDQGLITGPVPGIRGRCWQRAARRSFFSRDNAENFLTFCRDLGVHENLLFESDDLVLHNQPRQVVLCLLEVARLAARLGVEPPGLVQLEREIAREEHDSGLEGSLDDAGWQFRDDVLPHCSVKETSLSPGPDAAGEDSAVDDVDGEGEEGGTGEGEGDAASVRSGGTADSSDSDVPLRPTNDLDKRVQLVTRLLARGCRCGAARCSRLLKVKKVSEGRYNIAGRNVFIRLLKGRHMMVRVGGGWDTLEHFLSRHEACQVRLVTEGKRGSVLPVGLPPPPSLTPTASTSSVDTREHSISPATSKTSLTKDSGTASPVEMKLLCHSGKMSTAKTSSGKVSPQQNGRRNSTPKPKTSRTGLTLPIKENDPTPRARKQSAPSSLSTPTTPVSKSKAHPLSEHRKSLGFTPTALATPKKSRSMSLAAVQDDKKAFCGSDRLNQTKSKSISVSTTPTESTPARKVRSQSLASTPISSAKKSFCGSEKVNNFAKNSRSLSLAAVPGALTQAAIEQSVKQSLIASIDDSSKKPFLHIKAKYRSPPPREVPPR